MNIKYLKSRAFLFLLLFLLLLPTVGFSEKDPFRAFLGDALKAYIKGDYAQVMNNLKEASLFMRNRAPLTSEALVFCEEIEMFAKYKPRKDSVFAPGEEFIVYFQPGNYSLLHKKDGWEINLKEYFKITDDKGNIVSKMDDPLVFHTTLRSPLTTALYFKNADFVPEKEGKYILEVVLEDLIKGKKLVAKLPFEVRTKK